MATVLLVEDDHVVRGAMLRSLADRGHAVHAVGTALDALRRVAAETPDLVVLDLGLPDLDGSDALRMLRGITDVPIIIATARDDEQAIVRLLRAGADDYMVKPFTGAHLDARITTVLRRAGRASRTVQPAVHEVGGLRVDVGERSAQLDGVALALTRKEFDLLAYLAARPGRVVSRRELLEEVWRQPSVGEDQTIDVHLYWLRRKLGESAAKPRYLRTVRGSDSGWWHRTEAGAGLPRRRHDVDRGVGVPRPARDHAPAGHPPGGPGRRRAAQRGGGRRAHRHRRPEGPAAGGRRQFGRPGAAGGRARVGPRWTGSGRSEGRGAGRR
ncbi:hypothetical protein GCM10027605_26130 [Micromonospora zhanjiangensis]